MRRLSAIVLSLALVMMGCSSRSKEMKNAETYIQVNELGIAKEPLDLEIQTSPKNAEAYAMLAKLFLLGGDPLDARAAFHKALLLDTGTKGERSKMSSICSQAGNVAAVNRIRTILGAIV